MSDLSSIFAALQRHHIATVAEALPIAQSGITWLWASNGVFKRGVDQALDVLICAHPTRPTPGLAQLVPHVRYASHSGRIPGELLTALLEHARKAADDRPGIAARSIEQQYFVTYREGLPRPFRVAVPEQTASATRIEYRVTVPGQILVDLHSHHRLEAYFSDTDDQDDGGLSVSAVIGRIFGEHPAICVRANVYGHRQRIPALTIFDCLPQGLRDTYRGQEVKTCKP